MFFFIPYFASPIWANPVVPSNESYIEIRFNKGCYLQGYEAGITINFYRDGYLSDPDDNDFNVVIRNFTENTAYEFKAYFYRESTGIWKSYSSLKMGNPGNRSIVVKATIGGERICRVEGFNVQTSEVCGVIGAARVEVNWDKDCYEFGDQAIITINTRYQTEFGPFDPYEIKLKFLFK